MEGTDKVLQRSKSSPLPLSYHFNRVQNDVVLPPQQIFKYIDILPPPSMLYFQDTLHRVYTDTDLQRYIKYKGRIVYLKNIIGQYYYSTLE